MDIQDGAYIDLIPKFFSIARAPICTSFLGGQSESRYDIGHGNGSNANDPAPICRNSFAAFSLMTNVGVAFFSDTAAMLLCIPT